MLRLIFLLLAGIASSVDVGHALTLQRPPEYFDLIGELRHARVEDGETLLDIARRHDLGQNEIVLANPALDRWLPAAGAEVLLPTRYILPNAKRAGLVLNVPEMRLYFFPKPAPGRGPVVITYPVSVGRMDWRTPTGTTRVTAKQKDPAWYPPASLREEAMAAGQALPAVIPPGPANPLGRHALRLGIHGYLIHGTNKPYGVGMRVTHGCLRMYPEDIAALFNDIPVGTPVQIVNQPVKVGWLDETLYLEIHPPLPEDSSENADFERQVMQAISDAIAAENTKYRVLLRETAITTAIQTRNGIPVAISR
jgi:L,D-transpeptidase ErfK/SrfK